MDFTYRRVPARRVKSSFTGEDMHPGYIHGNIYFHCRAVSHSHKVS